MLRLNSMLDWSEKVLWCLAWMYYFPLPQLRSAGWVWCQWDQWYPDSANFGKQSQTSDYANRRRLLWDAEYKGELTVTDHWWWVLHYVNLQWCQYKNSSYLDHNLNIGGVKVIVVLHSKLLKGSLKNHEYSLLLPKVWRYLLIDALN